MLVAIEKIQIGKRLRELREDSVADLMESINRLGLQAAISVASGIEKRPGDADGVSFELVAGRHRLEACKRLGWEEIEASIVQMSKDERLLWEIDENLCRADLTELERGEHLLKRKEIYDRLHPMARHGGDRKSGHFQDAENGALKPYHADVADKVGLAKSTIQHAIARVRRLDEKIRDRVRGIPEIANNARELEALGDMEMPEQRKAIALVESGQAAGIRDAKKLMEPKPPKLQPHFKEAEIARQKRRDAFTRAWNALDEEDREWARGHIDTPVADNTTALRAVQ
jgi:ParB family chromosome partitioning protein